MLKTLEHKNIVKLYDTFIHKNEIVMIMEYCDGGELAKYVEDNEGISEVETRAIIK